MAKQEKVETVERIKVDYLASRGTGGGVVFADYVGLKVSELSKLRRNLRSRSVKAKVLKNTLVRRALKESGVDGLEPILKGSTLVAFSPDEVSAPKVIVDFAKEIDPQKEGRLAIKGGVIGGKIVSKAEVMHLAALPSREEVFSKLLALINAPATQLLRLIKEPGAQVARVVKAVGDRQQA